MLVQSGAGVNTAGGAEAVRLSTYTGTMADVHHPGRDQIRLESVLAALGHPVRLQVLRVLADGREHQCGAIIKDMSKSTLTHHWRVLRESGVINQRASGRTLLLSLRREDLDARFPGLIDTILSTSASRSTPPA